MGDGIKWTELTPVEKSRTYTYPGGERITVCSVSKIEVRESGTHRLETADGRKLFVSKGWLSLEISADAWTF